MEKQHLWLHGTLYELTPVKDILASQGKYTKTSEELEEERIANLPKTWEDSINDGDTAYFINDVARVDAVDTFSKYPEEYKNSLHTEKQVKAMLALHQLIWLRDVYNGDWKADWDNKYEHKWVIVYADYFKIREQKLLASLLAFKSRELAELFLENFKDLIEKTKDLY